MLRRRTFLLLLGASFSLACSDSSGVGAGDGTSSVQDPTANGSFFDLVPMAPFEQAFRGVRRVDLFEELPGVAYREDVGSDGQGNFAIETIEVITPHPNPDLFRLLQDQRQVLSYRFRDWRIRDVDRFFQNYQALVNTETHQVAGIEVVQVSVERIGGGERRYVVDIDPNTGLVLAYEEYATSDGMLLAKVAFETFAYDGDVSDMQLTNRLFQTEEHDLGADLQAIFGFEPLVPSYSPGNGFVMQPMIEKLVAPDGEWSKVYLDDGLEVVMLMSQSATLTTDNTHLLGVLRSMQVGAWRSLRGALGGQPVIVAGKVSEDDLALTLQSAFE